MQYWGITLIPAHQATSDKFLPRMLGLETNDWINFWNEHEQEPISRFSAVQLRFAGVSISS